MKQKRIQKFLITTAVFAILGLMLLISTSSLATAQQAEKEFKIAPGCFDAYTSSQYLYDVQTGTNDITKSVYNYPQYFQTRYVETNTQARADEWLLKIVPIQVFQYPDEYLDIGKTCVF